MIPQPMITSEQRMQMFSQTLKDKLLQERNTPIMLTRRCSNEECRKVWGFYPVIAEDGYCLTCKQNRPTIPHTRTITYRQLDIVRMWFYQYRIGMITRPELSRLIWG